MSVTQVKNDSAERKRREMVVKKSWKEFKDSKLLWLVNRSLHIFGWAIIIEMNENLVTDVYPARVKFRGFDEQTESDGFIGLTEYMQKSCKILLDEVRE